MQGYFSAVVLSAALLTPVIVQADERHVVTRYYDRHGRDWHEWNDNEDQAYRRYLAEKRRDYRAFQHTPRNDQREYWKWRHEHHEDRRENERHENGRR